MDKEAEPISEVGRYQHKFAVPNSWKGNSVNIVFEEIMTDTEVKLNGKLAGEIYQEGFYEFSYDISDKINSGKSVCTWTWPVKFANEYYKSQYIEKPVFNYATFENTNEQTKLEANGVQLFSTPKQEFLKM